MVRNIEAFATKPSARAALLINDFDTLIRLVSLTRPDYEVMISPAE